MSGDLRAWRLRTALHRSGRQWRLLAVVATVAVLVGTLLSSLAVLLVATETQGVHGALTAADPARTELRVVVDELTVPSADARTAADRAVTELLAPAEAAGRGTEQSVLHRVERPDDLPALVYLGDVDGVEDATTLDAGVWPSATSGGTAGAGVRVPVAVPAALARDLALDVGSRVVVQPETSFTVEVELEVVGVFTVAAPGGRAWSADALEGREHDPDFVVPGSGGSLVTDAYGPLVTAPGALDAAGVAVDRLTVAYAPDFADATVADVVPLLERLARAAERGPAAVGAVGDTVRLSTPLAPVVQEVATAVVVTRASVLVVGLLLVLLAVAALLQTARLLVEARAGEQNLMRARGASGRQLLGLALTEAAGLALLTTAVSPVLARLVHLALARRPAMVSAGITDDPGIPAAAWLTAGAVAVVFAVVLVSPLLRRGGTFVDGEQARARPDRRAVLARSGLDLALVVVAAVAFTQLQSYRSPLTADGASLAVDPVLVAGPAVVLLAGALVGARLLPAASRVAERLGARGRGVVGPLAAWEVGRRSTRATAAVLLLTLALAVGTFSQTFLATWRQSQVDQAQLATGTAVAVQDAQPTSGQVAALSAPGVTDAVPQPTTRREAELAPAAAASWGGTPDGRDVHLLALTPESRETLDRGRMGRVSGAAIAGLETDLLPSAGIPLPDDVRGLSAVVRVGDAEAPLPVVALVRVVVEDADGLLTGVALGTTAVDGVDRRLDALLPATAGLRTPLQVVGVQTSVFVAEPATAAEAPFEEVEVVASLAELSALTPVADAAPADDAAPDVRGPAGPPDLDALGLVRAPVDVPAELDWTVLGSTLGATSAPPPPGTQLAVRLRGFVSDLLLGVGTVTQTVWAPAGTLPVVLSSGLAGNLRAEPGTGLQLVVDGAVVRVVVADVVPRVPTLARDETVVVDHTQLSRALVQAGAAGSVVDEWWVDVAPADVPAYLAALPPLPDGEPGATRAVAQADVTAAMLEHPLRVATQGALWLVTGAAAALAAVGFAVHATVSLRSRSVEFAQMRAIGLSRRRLTGVVALESLLLGTLGAGFGIALGTLLGHLVAPLVAVSATGDRPVPTVLVHVPWDQVALLALEVVAVLAVVVLVVARTQRSADPAAVMRLGDER